MNSPSFITRSHTVESHRRRPLAGFTLIEMLVVITIIGILAGLVTAAALAARRAAKNAAISTELKGGLDAACVEYKNQFGEYPPDFAGLQNAGSDMYHATPRPTYKQEAQNAVLRHLSNAFPQYIPGNPSGSPKTTQWEKLCDDVRQFWGLELDQADPTTALTFWLGGAPEWFMTSDATPVAITPTHPKFDPNKPVKSLRGWSTNVNNPFDTSEPRKKAFFEFDIASLAGSSGGLAYWAKSQSVSDKTTGAIVYFRAENGNYTYNGLNPPEDCRTTSGGYANVKNASGFVWPAVDTNLSNFEGMDKYDGGKAKTYKWVNEKTFQIFASGLDGKYSKPFIKPAPISNKVVDVTCYPTGESYRIDPGTGASPYDDITNFSNGTLESQMP